MAQVMQSDLNSSAGLMVPSEQVEEINTDSLHIILSSNKMFRHITYQMILRVPRTLREKLHTKSGTHAVSAVNVKCCKVGETSVACCETCGSPVIFVEREGKPYLDSEQCEEWAFAMKSRCSSSRDHLFSQVVMVLEVLLQGVKDPMIVVSPPITLQSRMKKPKHHGDEGVVWTNLCPSPYGEARLRPITQSFEPTLSSSKNSFCQQPQVLVAIVNLALPERIFSDVWRQTNDYISFSPKVLVKTLYRPAGLREGIVIVAIAAEASADCLQCKQALVDFATGPRNPCKLNAFATGLVHILSEFASWQ